TNWAQAQQKGHLSLSELSQDQEVNQLVADAVEQANQELASYETIKYFRILPEELSVSSETLTPTLKLKRRVVEKKYKHLLDEMYA
ncbi:MAG: long-chain fatty acid--CoA ligase, partial [Ardenticatenaceae bacterium]